MFDDELRIRNALRERSNIMTRAQSEDRTSRYCPYELRSFQSIRDGPGQQRNHDLVVTGDLVAGAAAYITADGQRIKEDFGHDDGRANVEHDAALQTREVRGEDPEIGHAGGADGGPI